MCRPDGVVAVRDADYAAMAWYPADPRLDRWLEVYRAVAHSNGAEPDAGRRLLSWARAAGAADVVATASVWCYATPADRQWWGGMWADRILQSAITRQAVDGGHADLAELTDISASVATLGRRRRRLVPRPARRGRLPAVPLTAARGWPRPRAEHQWGEKPTGVPLADPNQAERNTGGVESRPMSRSPTRTKPSGTPVGWKADRCPARRPEPSRAGHHSGGPTGVGLAAPRATSSRCTRIATARGVNTVRVSSRSTSQRCRVR